MTPYDRHLQAAQGYLELGLPLDAHEELEAIEPEMRDLSGVLALRVEVYRALEKWMLMEAVARQLCTQQPYDAGAFISLGFATRRAIGVQEALAVLAQVAPRFPNEAFILYNLACYTAQLGHLDVARKRLAEAIQIEPSCRELALIDPDLAQLRAKI